MKDYNNIPNLSNSKSKNFDVFWYPIENNIQSINTDLSEFFVRNKEVLKNRNLSIRSNERGLDESVRNHGEYKSSFKHKNLDHLYPFSIIDSKKKEDFNIFNKNDSLIQDNIVLSARLEVAMKK